MSRRNFSKNYLIRIKPPQVQRRPPGQDETQEQATHWSSTPMPTIAPAAPTDCRPRACAFGPFPWRP
ncbi:unnamed protein product, partial [Nesidiocoris tenuis]